MIPQCVEIPHHGILFWQPPTLYIRKIKWFFIPALAESGLKTEIISDNRERFWVLMRFKWAKHLKRRRTEIFNVTQSGGPGQTWIWSYPNIHCRTLPVVMVVYSLKPLTSRQAAGLRVLCSQIICQKVSLCWPRTRIIVTGPHYVDTGLGTLSLDLIMLAQD